MLYDSFLTGPLWSPLHPPDREAFAVVTGASSGLGLETAKLLYLYGFSVVLIARDSGRLAEAAETIHRADTQRKDNARWKDLMPKSSPQHKKRVITVTLDLARSDSLMALAAELHNHGVFNKIEVLVNNAGACDRREGFSSSNVDSAQELVALNVNAAVSITRLLLPQMVARKRGRVVFISSITSMSPTPQQSIYAASKAFLNSFALVRHYVHYLPCELLNLHTHRRCGESCCLTACW
jgi:short-subunit dehydrogenase